jgi:glutamate N-acetyltransferase / amino-acid N-acetyltransferase
MSTVPSSVFATLPLGFQWSSAKAGIKASGKPDLALAVCPGGASAAAMFTTNQVVAAPIVVGRRHLTAAGGRVSALIVNAGNANCATGEAGLDACLKSCIAVGQQFHCVFDEVFPSSTGIIGVPFPTEKLVAAIPTAAAALGSGPEHAAAFATAILTTDTKLKVAYASIEVEGKTVSIFGCAKGAGMIGPQLGPPHATMLVYLFTDLDATPVQLRVLLEPAVQQSFNCISIDGDMSTNDTVLLLASGRSGIKAAGYVFNEFAAALARVCDSLAHQIIDDGEGVTHVVTLEITGARTDAEAKQVAKTIAHSPLCKTAWSSADPNWGRLLAAAGYSGVAFDPAAVTIRVGELPVFEHGMRALAYDEAATHAHMSLRDYTIHIDLGQGAEHCRFLTCDLTKEYVSINADYST